MMSRLFVAVAAAAVTADLAAAQQFRRQFPAAPIIQPVVQPPMFRPAVVPVLPTLPVVPVIPPPSTAIGQIVDPFTGTVTQFGNTFDPFTGTLQQGASSYNPLTGTTRTSNTVLDPFTGAAMQRQTAGNPITGQFISTYRTQRPPLLGGPMFNPFTPRVQLFR